MKHVDPAVVISYKALTRRTDSSSARTAVQVVPLSLANIYRLPGSYDRRTTRLLSTCLFVIGNAVMEFERTIVESKKNAYKDKLDVHCLHVLG
ncbi:hypothetical protein KM043_004154 [Ampulex compressa]|nr:hypothetical protein KM043_004154 [Ampulex compressa]